MGGKPPRKENRSAPTQRKRDLMGAEREQAGMPGWDTISFCFKWAELLRGHPTPSGENRQHCPPPHDHCHPRTKCHRFRDTGTLCAMPPSLPHTSSWLESAAWPLMSSACPVCPRLDPGEAPSGGIWKRAKALSINTPEPSLCSTNQP